MNTKLALLILLSPISKPFDFMGTSMIRYYFHTIWPKLSIPHYLREGEKPRLNDELKRTLIYDRMRDMAISFLAEKIDELTLVSCDNCNLR